ncbi:slbp2 [Symbiodinium sp. CCMP2592]|nr:slbp2 [Symbiodinium sp. CCMP2592]
MVSVAIGAGLGAIAGGLAARLWASEDVGKTSWAAESGTPDQPKVASGQVHEDRLHDLLLQLGHSRLHVFQLENRVLAESYRKVATGLVAKSASGHEESLMEPPATATGNRTRGTPVPAVSSGAPDRLHGVLLLLLQLERGRRRVFQLENQVLAESHRTISELRASVKSAEGGLQSSGALTASLCTQREEPMPAKTTATNKQQVPSPIRSRKKRSNHEANIQNRMPESLDATDTASRGWTQLQKDKQLAERIQQAVTAYLLGPEQAITEDFRDSDTQEETQEQDGQRYPVDLPPASGDAEYSVMPHAEDPMNCRRAPFEATSDEPGKCKYTRTRQIMIGKARPEYLRYREQVPFECRGPMHPRTPNAMDKCSKRDFDRKLSKWRRQLHNWSDVFPAGQRPKMAPEVDLHSELFGHRPIDGNDSTHVVVSFSNRYGIRPSFSNFPHSNLKPEFFTNILDILMPEGMPKFVVEVGSLHGHSAIHMATVLDQFNMYHVPILCIDPFTGDTNMWANYQTDRSVAGWVKIIDGRMMVFDQFMANVQFAINRTVSRNHILPFQATSTVGARWLVEKHFYPDLVFLDSAHELDETFLELSLYYDILEPGGIMFGDDYGWAAVRQDVQRFVEHRNSHEADPPEFRIIRAEPGSSHVLWMLRKPKVET